MDYLQKVKEKRADGEHEKHKKELVKSFNNLSNQIKTLLDSLKTTGATKLDKDFIKAVKGLEKVAGSMSEVKITHDDTIRDALVNLAYVLKTLEVKPTVNVPQPKVVVNERELDLKPLLQAVNKLDNKTEVNIDVEALQESVGKVETAIKNLQFPASNFILPFKSTSGAATQVQLTSSGEIPVSATIEPAALQDVNITEVGGNTVTTTVPVSGTVTANLGTLNGAAVAANQQTDALTNTELRASAVDVNTELPAAATLGDNDANPTTPTVGAALMGFDSSTWDRLRTIAALGDGGTGAALAVGSYVYNGTTWDRIRGDIANGVLVNLGSNNDVTVTSGTINLGATDNAVLDSIDEAVSSKQITGIGHGVKTVTSAGTDEALAASTACKRVTIMAQSDNTGVIAVGASGVDATVATGTGVLLFPGDVFELDIDNLADVFIDASVNGEGVRFTYFS